MVLYLNDTIHYRGLVSHIRLSWLTGFGALCDYRRLAFGGNFHLMLWGLGFVQQIRLKYGCISELCCVIIVNITHMHGCKDSVATVPPCL